MKRVVFEAARKVSIQEVPVPKPQPGEALLKIKYIGICGSDLHSYRDANPYVKLPRVPGHELCAEVVEAPQSRGRIAVGDLVVVEPSIRCGVCYPCHMGRYNCCENLKVVGIHVDGGMAEEIALPIGQIHKLPEGLDPALGPLAETLSIARHACDRGRVDTPDKAAVVGAGPVGLCAALIAKDRGAEVAVVDMVASRLALAQELGMDHVIDAREKDVHLRLKTVFDGRPPTVVIEAVGRAATFEMAVDVASPAGRVVVVGLSTEPASVRPDVIIKKELDIVASRNSRDAFPKVIEFLARSQQKAAKLVTHRFRMDEAEKAMQLLDEKPWEAIKIILSA